MAQLSPYTFHTIFSLCALFMLFPCAASVQSQSNELSCFELVKPKMIEVTFVRRQRFKRHDYYVSLFKPDIRSF